MDQPRGTSQHGLALSLSRVCLQAVLSWSGENHTFHTCEHCLTPNKLPKCIPAFFPPFSASGHLFPSPPILPVFCWITLFQREEQSSFVFSHLLTTTSTTANTNIALSTKHCLVFFRNTYLIN